MYEDTVRLENLEAFIALQNSWEQYKANKGGIEAELVQIVEDNAELTARVIKIQEVAIR